MTEKLISLPSKDQFLEHLDSVFRGTLDNGQVIDFRLFELDSSNSNAVQEVFSLMFKAPVDAPPVQNIFHLVHEKLGPMDLFLVPIKKNEDGLIFESVFNRLIV